jgi:pyruvate carboxylase subunit B
MKTETAQWIINLLVNIVDLTLRDAHQTLLATRLKTDDMIPILDKIDGAGGSTR